MESTGINRNNFANHGNDSVIVALVKERQRKMMPPQYSVNITEGLIKLLKEKYGDDFVKVRQ